LTPQYNSNRRNDLPFWSRKKPKWTDKKHDDFYKMVTKNKEYAELKRHIGTFADDTIEAIWIQYTGGKVGAKFSYMTENKDDVLKGFSITIRHEITNILMAHYHLGSLAVRAQTGKLRSTLRDKGKQPHEYGALSTDTEMWKAAKWIVNSSNSLKGSKDDESAPVNLSKIYNAINHVVTSMDVRSLEALAYLHQNLVNQTTLKETRGPSTAVKYCSTGGARYLQERAAAMARGISLPSDGSDKWDDLACYFLGAHMRAHGFTDGNGRAVRGLFACTLLKGGRDFIVPEASFEKQLHCL
jgi:hypothetical protein